MTPQPPTSTTPTPTASATLDDWVSRQADEVIAAAHRLGTPVVCASGLSPSGPIHLGNLREVMTPHLVADEVRRRGIACDHLLSWDDYDRFRKVPAGIDGVDDSWNEHIGKPLTAVPPPPGSEHDSWAAHFRAQCEQSLAELGITYRGISQSAQYTAGAYVEQVLFAMQHRTQIDTVLARYRTLDAAEGSGAAAEDDGSAGAGYYPYKPYCTVCERDTTTVTGYDDDSTELTYTCTCGHTETVLLKDFHHGKLVWKVDWPMRWAYEKVIFEPSGVDHQSPGSSFAVGLDLAPLFGWQRPIGPMYAFVGIKGMAKMSSSRGQVPVPADALQIMEPAVLRWMYARRKPNQSFEVAFDAELLRLYDEWDALNRRISAGSAQAAEQAAHARASGTADGGPLPVTPRAVAYRTLASVVDITTGDADQLRRIVSQVEDEPIVTLDELRPRLSCVEHWVADRMPPEERTVVREAPDAVGHADLTDDQRDALSMLLDGNGNDLPPLESAWTIDGLTHQVYGVPKVQRGLAADQIVKGDKELSTAQREFFRLVYQLLIGKDTGPRLPTLLLAVGPERVRQLLSVPAR